ncbi:hypothetical protein Nepgr_004339 [Nepenthes gracilis]|uniref:Uncharacterized protein n=1 Tax=Nepenthes gracilis TaxID=150966 RepID=A0AAD3S166_NEPGR|nr:hypothetical protein Nepgr_004339 [Nepenthes gracilis]
MEPRGSHQSRPTRENGIPSSAASSRLVPNGMRSPSQSPPATATRLISSESVSATRGKGLIPIHGRTFFNLMG